jgi:hypothetical protein
MPNINDRIGSQNVIRVLSNAAAPPTKLITLSDVDSTFKTLDGMILVWDLPTEKFIMTSVIDSSTTTIKGVAYFDNTTNSTLPANGALIVSGGVGIGRNLNVSGDIVISGISTFSSNLDINAAVDILNGLVVNDNFQSVGITSLASAGGITTTGGDLYAGGDLFVRSNLKIDGASEFIGNVIFRGGTIGIGDSISDDINVEGEFISNLVPNSDGEYSLGITTQRWRDGLFSGLVTSTNLFVSGITTLAYNGGITTTGGDLYIGRDLYIFNDLVVDEVNARNANITGIATISTLGVTGLTTTKNLLVTSTSIFEDNISVTGFVTVTEGIYYNFGNYDGPNGVAYFDNSGKLIGAASTENAATTTYFILTTDSVGIPTWTSIIDGGEF